MMEHHRSSRNRLPNNVSHKNSRHSHLEHHRIIDYRTRISPYRTIRPSSPSRLSTEVKQVVLSLSSELTLAPTENEVRTLSRQATHQSEWLEHTFIDVTSSCERRKGTCCHHWHNNMLTLLSHSFNYSSFWQHQQHCIERRNGLI